MAKKGCKSNLPEELREKGGPGRPPGVPNKLTKCMKAQTWRVFEALEADAKTSLLEIAKKNPAWFHSVFSSRIIPKDVTLRTITSINDLTPEEIDALLTDLQARISHEG
jgi:hypothetical protein